MIHILIVDDHQIVIDGLKLMLSSQSGMQCIAEANNGEEALQQAKRYDINIALIDINMPGMNGINLCKRLQEEAPHIKVIALSMFKEASLVKTMLKNGAKGYLLKNAGRDEVIEAIHRIHAGKNYFSEEITETIMNSFGGQGKKSQNSPFPQISRREKQVLQLIVDEFTTAEIAEKLFISFGTVETHRRNLLIKLGARNTAGLVRVALEYGLLEER